MQCKYWNLLAMVKAPHCLLLLPYIHICSWGKGGWEVWPVKYRQNLEDRNNEYS